MASTAEKAVTEYIGDQLRRMRAAGEGKKPVSYEKIAAELGLTKPAIFGLVKGTGGAGPKVEQIFAARLFGGSIDKLRAAAVKWWETQAEKALANAGLEPVSRWTTDGSAPDIVVRYPSLRIVIEAKGNAERWSPSAVAAAESMQLDADQDPGERWWTETLDRLDAAIKVSIPKLPDRGADAAADLDRAPRRRVKR